MRKFKITYILNFSAPFSAEFPRSQDKIVGISKNFLRSLAYFYTYPAKILSEENVTDLYFFLLLNKLAIVLSLSE